MKKYLPLAIGLAMSVPVLASAQEASEQMMTRDHFEQLDTDGNNAVSRHEYHQFMEGAFDKLDTNGDGNLDKAEGTTVLTPEQFNNVDADKNGRLDHDEFMNRVMADFDKQDRDGDGALRQP